MSRLLNTLNSERSWSFNLSQLSVSCVLVAFLEAEQEMVMGPEPQGHQGHTVGNSLNSPGHSAHMWWIKSQQETCFSVFNFFFIIIKEFDPT